MAGGLAPLFDKLNGMLVATGLSHAGIFSGGICPSSHTVKTSAKTSANSTGRTMRHEAQSSQRRASRRRATWRSRAQLALSAARRTVSEPGIAAACRTDRLDVGVDEAFGHGMGFLSVAWAQSIRLAGAARSSVALRLAPLT